MYENNLIIISLHIPSIGEVCVIVGIVSVADVEVIEAGKGFVQQLQVW